MGATKVSQRTSEGSSPTSLQLRETTWEEVSKHNTESDCWITIDDVAYDMTGWVHKHPGGSELMLTFAGREATHAFNSYHCFSKTARKTLAGFAVAKVVNAEHPKYAESRGFYEEVTARVEEYMRRNNMDPKDWRPGVMHFLLMMLIAAFSFALCYNVFQLGWSAQLVGAVLLGWIQALPLLHIMHDCSHGACSHSPWVWDYVGKFVMDLYAGANMTAWHLQHVVGHHVWTNVFGSDPDLPPAEEGDPRYLVKKQKWAPMYKYQHIYLPIAYGVLGLKVRYTDFLQTFQEYAGPLRVRKHTVEWYVKWVVVKMAWIMWRIVFPIAVLGVPVVDYIILFLITDAITGWYLAFNFQVSHISDAADYPLGDKGAKSDVCNDEWAVSQIKTSVDYAHGNKLMTWLCGALNYQTVHHLFPGVTQYHYPRLAPVIMEVCKKHNVKYNALPTFSDAFFAHLRYLREMGQQGIPVEVHMG
eukprot:Sspe_Gene.50538::Locus_28132_Transcript_2_2_Confidence_0.800_Length_1528::g.50538::m.50538